MVPGTISRSAGHDMPTYNMRCSDASGHVPPFGLRQQMPALAPILLFLGTVCAGDLAVLLHCPLLGFEVLFSSSKELGKHAPAELPKMASPFQTTVMVTDTTTASTVSIALTIDGNGLETSSVRELNPPPPRPTLTTRPGLRNTSRKSQRLVTTDTVTRQLCVQSHPPSRWLPAWIPQ